MFLIKKLLFNYNDVELEFRTILIHDVNQTYVDGLKNEKKYLLNIPNDVTLSSQRKYINEIITSKNNTICGLFNSNELIGTAGIQLTKQNSENINYATIGIFIFNPNYRGIGLGKTLVWASVILINKTMKIKLYGAGMEKTNLPSLNSFLSCGFQSTSNNKNYNVKLNFDYLIKPNQISGIKFKKDKNF